MPSDSPTVTIDIWGSLWKAARSAVKVGVVLFVVIVIPFTIILSFCYVSLRIRLFLRRRAFSKAFLAKKGREPNLQQCMKDRLYYFDYVEMLRDENLARSEERSSLGLWGISLLTTGLIFMACSHVGSKDVYGDGRPSGDTTEIAAEWWIGSITAVLGGIRCLAFLVYKIIEFQPVPFDLSWGMELDEHPDRTMTTNAL